MCGRYYIEPDNFEMREIIQELTNKVGNEPPIKTGEIFPTNSSPIITYESDKPQTSIMKWGFPNYRNKGVIINARAETVLEKRTFRDSILNRRCIIPASGFFEWKENENKKKDKYLFALPQSNIMFIAGFFNTYKSDGGMRNCFVILTTAANESLEEIHDRMPLVINNSAIKEWVNNYDYAIEILQNKPPQLNRVVV